MRIPGRLFLLMVVTVILLVSGISIAAALRASAVTPVDCAGDCRTNRDTMMERCDNMPDAARAGCRERANTQYDRCIERCSGRRSKNP